MFITVFHPIDMVVRPLGCMSWHHQALLPFGGWRPDIPAALHPKKPFSREPGLFTSPHEVPHSSVEGDQIHSPLPPLNIEEGQGSHPLHCVTVLLGAPIFLIILSNLIMVRMIG